MVEISWKIMLFGQILPILHSVMSSYQLEINYGRTMIPWKFFFFSFGPTCGIWKFSGQRSNWTCSCSLWLNTATPDLSCICHLHRSLWQYQRLNSLAQARNGTRVLTETMSRSLTQHWATRGTPEIVEHNKSRSSLFSGELAVKCLPSHSWQGEHEWMSVPLRMPDKTLT